MALSKTGYGYEVYEADSESSSKDDCGTARVELSGSATTKFVLHSVCPPHMLGQ